MAIVRQDVIDGPNIQADGSYRGVVEFEFDDGRIVERRIRAADAAVWSNTLVDLPALVEDSIQKDDADEAVAQDIEVQPYKQASKPQIAIAYLRKAHASDDPYIAYLRFERFNDWRLAEGYNLPQVKAALLAAGLPEDEYDAMLLAYQWLDNPGRVTAMQAYQDVKNTWPDYKG